MIALWLALALAQDPSADRALNLRDAPVTALHTAVAEPAPPLVPVLPSRGAGGAVGFGAATVLAWVAARGLGRARARLLPDGILPRAAGLAEVVARLLVALLALAAVAAIVPASLAPALPLVVLAAAAALGWSARDFLPDVVAGLVLVSERRLHVGDFMTLERHSGRIERIGTRVTLLRDRAGRVVTVPNRELLRQPVVSDRDPWPLIEVTVDGLVALPPERARTVLTEAAALAPWSAPSAPVVVTPDPEKPGRWRVRTRLLEGRFADRFEAALTERVSEAVLSRSPEGG